VIESIAVASARHWPHCTTISSPSPNDTVISAVTLNFFFAS